MSNCQLIIVNSPNINEWLSGFLLISHALGQEDTRQVYYVLTPLILLSSSLGKLMELFSAGILMTMN